jgi:putative endonuclease
MSWITYIVACADNTLYTGVTTDIHRRINEHNGEGSTASKGAKYTRVRRPVKLLYSESVKDRSEACKRESAIKKLSKQQKLLLIANGK